MKKHLPKVVVRILKGTAKAVAYCVLGSLVTLTLVGIYMLNQKPELKPWHTATLDAEFTTKSDVKTFADYLELEDRLFAQLEEEVCDKITAADRNSINRFDRESPSSPGRWPRNWNRSYEFAVDPAVGEARAGVLLLHGLTDSPYSLRGIGERLHQAGAHVLGLRIPGHGTAPAALSRTRWQDMAAAVEIAARHLHEQTGDRPLFVIGYSNGAALAVKYALSAIEDDSLPRFDGIVLISPEIGVTPAAGLAVWQERIGRLLGLRKLNWKSVLPEYDPFKYNSFPINAGNLPYELTRENKSELARLEAAGRLDAFPPVLGFQSVVDATVSAAAVVEDLFAKLPGKQNELVGFGLNRTVESEPLLMVDPRAKVREVLDDPERRFVFSLVTNVTPESEQVVVRTWAAGIATPTERDLGLSWPEGVHSLSHVALPFRKDDLLYGSADMKDRSPGIHLGDAALRGERGVITIPAGEMLRQRWNPFYSYLEERLLERLGLSE